LTPEDIAKIPGVAPAIAQIYATQDNSLFWSKQMFDEEWPHIVMCGVYFVTFFIARYLIQSIFLGPIARFFNITSKTGVYKFKETGWYAIYYTVFFGLGMYVLHLESIAHDHGVTAPSSAWTPHPSRIMWIGWPLHPFPTFFKTYYLLETAFYLHCIFARLFERKQKDFYEMTLHHLATFALVWASYWIRYQRPGMLVLIVHNLSDIFLYGGKCFHYIAQKVPSHTTLAKIMSGITNTLFLIFTVSFFLTRLVYLPFYIARSALFDAPQYIPQAPYIRIALVFLFTLVGLHCFWFYLIVRMLVRVLRSDEFNDIRSDSDEEKDDATPKDQVEPAVRHRKKTSTKEKRAVEETEKSTIPNGHAKKEKRKSP